MFNFPLFALLITLAESLLEKKNIVVEDFRRHQVFLYRFRQIRFNFMGSNECCNPIDGNNPDCPTPCSREVMITENGVSVSRVIPNDTDPEGIFMFNRVVRSGDPNPVFSESLRIDIVLRHVDSGRLLGTYTIENFFMAPNNEYKLVDQQIGSGMFDILVSYHCVGWTGYNCRFPCSTESQKMVDCSFDTEIQFCRNGNVNPPECTLDNLPCPLNTCKNNAICLFVYPKDFICQCEPGWTGKHCDVALCEIPCDVDNGVCSNPNTCTCNPGFTGLTCSEATCTGFQDCFPNGVCIITKNEHSCECDTTRFSGPNCDKTCTPACVFGNCVHANGETECICDEGFEGDDCSAREFTLAPLFESGYVSSFKQRIIIGSTVGSLLVAGFIIMGATLYLRQNPNRNIGIMRKTAYIVNKLQGTTAGELLVQNE